MKSIEISENVQQTTTQILTTTARTKTIQNTFKVPANKGSPKRKS